MSTHTRHPSIIDYGLADGCDRCAEIARQPLRHLDDDNLRSLLARTSAWMRDTAYPRSECETIAMRELEQVIVAFRHLRRLGFTEDHKFVEGTTGRANVLIARPTSPLASDTSMSWQAESLNDGPAGSVRSPGTARGPHTDIGDGYDGGDSMKHAYLLERGEL